MSSPKRWVDEIHACLEALGGAARLEDIYLYIERTTTRELSNSWRDTIRRTLGDHSSDSAHFAKNDDLFENTAYGHWKLRDAIITEEELRVRDQLDPAGVLDRVLVREHYRSRPIDAGAEMTDPLFHMISDGPRPVAPFSHATEANGWVFVTGQMPTFPDAPDAPLPEGIEAQTVRVMENLKIVLGGIDMGLEHVMMARCYLTDFYRDYAQFNETYQSFFPKDRRPARTTIGVTGLALHALVEIDFICKRPD